jgi:hypothetical protein
MGDLLRALWCLRANGWVISLGPPVTTRVNFNVRSEKSGGNPLRPLSLYPHFLKDLLRAIALGRPVLVHRALLDHRRIDWLTRMQRNGHVSTWESPAELGAQAQQVCGG